MREKSKILRFIALCLALVLIMGTFTFAAGYSERYSNYEQPDFVVENASQNETPVDTYDEPVAEEADNEIPDSEIPDKSEEPEIEPDEDEVVAEGFYIGIVPHGFVPITWHPNGGFFILDDNGTEIIEANPITILFEEGHVIDASYFMEFVGIDETANQYSYGIQEFTWEGNWSDGVQFAATFWGQPHGSASQIQD